MARASLEHTHILHFWVYVTAAVSLAAAARATGVCALVPSDLHRLLESHTRLYLSIGAAPPMAVCLAAFLLP